ncbi:MAG: type II secretion system protein GspM [Alphaproteobacteria bacterium]|nr:type II secretion system protein GspM [Alphaproteobacteria bacterium]
MFERGSPVSRTLALAILAALPLLAVQGAVAPYAERYRQNREAIVQATQLVARYQSLADRRVGLEAEIARLDAAESPDAGYLEGASDALAAAELQDLVETMVETAGGQVVSVQTLPSSSTEQEEAPFRTGLQVRFAAAVDQLANALYALETGEPFLFVDRLDVSKSGGGKREAEPGAPTVDVRLDVFGYRMWRGDGS